MSRSSRHRRKITLPAPFWSRAVSPSSSRDDRSSVSTAKAGERNRTSKKSTSPPFSDRGLNLENGSDDGGRSSGASNNVFVTRRDGEAHGLWREVSIASFASLFLPLSLLLLFFLFRENCASGAYDSSLQAKASLSILPRDRV